MPSRPRPAIPDLPHNVPPEMRDVLDALKEIVETITGRRPTAIARDVIPDQLGPSASLSEVINFCNKLRALLFDT